MILNKFVLLFKKAKNFLSNLFNSYIPLDKAVKKLYNFEKKMCPQNIPIDWRWGWKNSDAKKVIKEYYLFNRGLQDELYGLKFIIFSGKLDYPHQKINKEQLPCYSYIEQVGKGDVEYSKRYSTKFHLKNVWRGNDIVTYVDSKNHIVKPYPSYTYKNIDYYDVTSRNPSYERFCTVIFKDVSIRKLFLNKVLRDIRKDSTKNETENDKHAKNDKRKEKRRSKRKNVKFYERMHKFWGSIGMVDKDTELKFKLSDIKNYRSPHPEGIFRMPNDETCMKRV